MATLDERLRMEIGDLVVKVHALSIENENLKAQVAELQGVHKEDTHVPEQKARRKANAQAQAGDSPLPA